VATITGRIAVIHGFTSIEADVWLVDGELLVAHDLEDTEPGRTLQALYLDPLREIARANHGRVFPDRTAPVQLLVDIKSEAEPTWRALEKALGPYRPMLSRFGPDGTDDGAIEVVVSGNRPRQAMADEAVRWSAYDGRLSDLDESTDTFMPLISDRWTTTFTWRGIGPMPPNERARLDRIVATAHGDGQRVRFWATPDERGDPLLVPAEGAEQGTQVVHASVVHASEALGDRRVTPGPVAHGQVDAHETIPFDAEGEQVPHPGPGVSALTVNSLDHVVDAGTLPRVEQLVEQGGSPIDGVAYETFHRAVVEPALRPGARITHIVVGGLDRYRAAVTIEDAMADNVLLAEHLDGRPLDSDHGAPLRFVSPSQYGYVSIKHLCRIELHESEPKGIGDASPAMRLLAAHPRARVWQEERHRHIPAWALRRIYRATIPRVMALSARGSEHTRG
jgi:hypothetical protein